MKSAPNPLDWAARSTQGLACSGTSATLLARKLFDWENEESRYQALDAGPSGLPGPDKEGSR